ncbi:hypothetical protein PO909_001526 [Leuciscus waleckii]
MVTVSSAQPSAPKSIFALSQCSAGSDGFLTVGCLTRGFSPADSLTFKWKAPGGKDLNTFVQYPAFGSDGDYTKISHIRVKKSDWNPENPYICEASNLKGNLTAASPAPQPATVVLEVPTIKELENGTATFSCSARQFSPKTYSFKWFQDDEVKNAIDTYDTSEKKASVTLYSATSTFQISVYKWTNTDVKVKCEFEHKTGKEVREVQYKVPNQPATVVLTEPTKKELESGTATFSCSARQFSPKTYSFKWFQDDEVKNAIDTYNTSEKKASVTLYSATSTFQISADTLKNKDVNITCEFEHKMGKEVREAQYTVNRVTPPTIALLSKEEGDSIVLQCQLKDYYPNNITVQWLRGDQPVRASENKTLQTTDEKTFTYISQISIGAQYEDKNYTCKASHNSTDFKLKYDMCMAKSVCKPSVKVSEQWPLRAPLRDILKENKVTISCIVEAPHNTEVSWLADGTSKNGTRALNDLLNTIVSNLTLSRDEWLKLKTIVCTAKHPCFPEVNDTIQAGMKKDPVVMIRRKSAQSGIALLECVVKDLSSGEVCISFQANSADISDFTCVDWTPSENISSLTTNSTIPIEHQKKGNNFTCKVHSPFKSWASEPAGNLCDDPTIELVVVPSLGQSSSEPQRLLCSGKGFDLKIKWFSKSAEKPGTALEVSMMENGCVKVDSEILVPQQEWDQGVTYTCKIVDEHSGKTVTKNTSICAAKSVCKPSVKVKRAHLRDILKENKVTISCTVEAPHNTEVFWLANGTNEKGTRASNDLLNTIVSNLTLSRDEWLKLKTIVCTAKHPCFPEVNDTIQADDMKKDPVVMIRRKSAQSGIAFLECVVKDLSSGEVCISFQANSANISDFTCVDWTPSENISSLTTHFTIPSEHQKKGNNFTCKVHRTFKSWASEPAGNLCDDPTIELVVVPSLGQSSSEPQRLLCSGKGFDLKIKWFSKSAEKPGTALEVSMMENGCVKVDSEILVPQQEWDQGVTYTCQIVDEHSGKTANKSTSICAAKSVFKPSVKVKRAHLRDILKENKVTISCTVEAPHNTEVFWLANGTNEKGTRAPNDLLNTIVSNLTLSRDEWLKLKTIVCTAKHPCFPEVNDTIQADDMKKDPVVMIRRKSAQSGIALLECVVKDLSSGEVCISFQANSADISDFTCVDWTPSENISSLTTHSTIPSEHQKKGNNFTCKVHRTFKSWASEPAGNLCDDPTIELVVVPSLGQSSSEPQRLLCSGKGFDLKIKWFSNFTEKSDTPLEVSVMENGCVKVDSEILVPQQEWDQGVTYTCQIVDEHSGKTANKSTSICAVISPSSQQSAVYLKGPINHVRSGAPLNLTCLVVGQNVNYFSIQWKENGIVQNSFNQTHIDHADGTQSKKSIFEVSFKQWNTYAVFTCEVKHLCSNVSQQQNISKNRDPKQPIVRILRPSDSDLSGQNTSLLCFITGFFPSDISVQWQLNGKQFNESHFTNSPAVAHTSGGFSMHSALILPASQLREGVYSCIVSHESSQSPFIANLENLYASLIPSAPSAKLLQGASELVCLAYGFSPPDINITWLLGMNEVSAHNDTNPAKGPDGKFSIRSHLQLLPLDWAPGEVYTCRVTHVTGTQLLNISKKSALFEEAIYMNENKPEYIVQDTIEETWNMACAFLTLFLLSLLYGCTVTLVKVKPK